MAEIGDGKRAGTGSLVGGVLLGLTVAAMGAAFVALLWHGFQKARAMDGWLATPCTIVSSEVTGNRPTPHSPESYVFEVAYAYRAGDESYLGEVYKKGDGASQNKPSREERAKDFPVGKDAICYVNPDNPSESVLKRDSKAAGYAIWFPALFVVGGLGIVFGSIRSWWRGRRASAER